MTEPENFQPKYETKVETGKKGAGNSIWYEIYFKFGESWYAVGGGETPEACAVIKQWQMERLAQSDLLLAARRPVETAEAQDLDLDHASTEAHPDLID